ncbi:MAG: hypothetical protein ACOYJX_01565 [Acutalibacteraceae bacterium]|jgi:hypothetical protein
MSDKKKTKITWKDFKHLPWWTWLFIVACIVLPITTLGGAIPTLLAFLGIILCVKVSSLSTIRTPLKFFSCFGIAAAVWGIAYLFIFVMKNL